MANLYHSALGGPHSVEQFRARNGQAAQDAESALFGTVRADVVGTGTRLHLLDGKILSPGTVLVRPLSDDGAGNFFENGSWRIFASGLNGLRGAITVRTAAREVSLPGENMKTPSGLTIYDSTGSPIPQPGPGEPERDQWTGELIPVPEPPTP